MQLGRLFEIVYILLERKQVTAKELAAHFEVSVRTIYRDVEILSVSGIPIYMSKGKGGGISLLPNFVLDKSVITENEKKEVLSSLYALKTVGLEQQLTAFSKLKSIFGVEDTQWLEIDFGFWSDGEKEAELFRNLKQGILYKREVSFYYTNMKENDVERNVEPLKLVFKGTSWYLYGYCKLRNDYRFFKLKRIRELKVLNIFFTRKIPENVIQKNNYSEQKHKVMVKFKINKKASYRVYDDFTNVKILPDGTFLIEEMMEVDEWFIYHLISYGENLEVIEPVELKQQIKHKLSHLLLGYNML